MAKKKLDLKGTVYQSIARPICIKYASLEAYQTLMHKNNLESGPVIKLGCSK